MKTVLTKKVLANLFKVLEITQDDVLVSQHYPAKDGKDEMQTYILKGFLEGKQTLVINFYGSGNLIAVVNEKVGDKWETKQFLTTLEDVQIAINSRGPRSAKIDLSKEVGIAA